jgi:ubiquinol-cytochrome c reductase cytochrome c subunit
VRRSREVPPRPPEGPITAARTSVRTLAGVVLVWGALAGVLALLLPGSSQAQPADVDEDTVQLGGELFQANCAACHGPTGQGGPGTAGDLTLGPPIHETDINYSDMTMRTGRMPIADREAGVYIEEFDDEQREAVVAWMLERLEVPGEPYEVLDGDPGRGQELYARNCVACHGAGGAGGISGAGVTVPPVSGLDPVATFQGTRVGPFEMPAFSEQILDDQQVSDIAAYLEAAEDAPSTLLGIHEVDEITGALFAAALALAAGLVLLVTDRARRLSRLGGPTPAPGLPRDATPQDEVEP